MRQELDEKLVKQFPLLYSDRRASIYASCMSFGFEHGDGWFNILWKMSEKLEPLIAKFIRDNPDATCRVCSDEKTKHYASKTPSPGKCLAIHRFQTKYLPWYLWNPKYTGTGTWQNNLAHWFATRVVWPTQSLIRRIVDRALSLFFSELSTCWCEKYEHPYPRASQIKEKFGTLRVYLTCGTDEMFQITDEAESASSHICEACGKPGNRRDESYWITTRCDECFAKDSKLLLQPLGDKIKKKKDSKKENTKHGKQQSTRSQMD